MPYPAHAVLGFPGQFANSQQLAGAQHYYNRYRDYDVNTGRYIQADPIGLAGDDNPYAYAGGNPLKFKDPEGLWLDTVADVGFVTYDIYRLMKDNVFGRNCPDTLGTNLTALGADLASALIPGFTGGGLAVRAEKITSRAARRKAMREAGIPTSQAPVSQSRNASGREYSYKAPSPAGGSRPMSVQQQTMDRSHPNQPHWEAGQVKTDPRTGVPRKNDYGRPALTNDKSKANY